MVVDKSEDALGGAVEIERSLPPPEVEVERDIGAVLLDIGTSNTNPGTMGLKLSPNGHVRVLYICPPRLTIIRVPFSSSLT